jgi:hypothetical protein
LPPYYPGGAVQNKVTDSGMAAHMTFVAHLGHACGTNFKAKSFLAGHPEFGWQMPSLRDMDSMPWSIFSAGEKGISNQ